MGEQPVKNKTKEELIVIIKHLFLREIEDYKDENESLWFMLEELEEVTKQPRKLWMNKAL